MSTQDCVTLNGLSDKPVKMMFRIWDISLMICFSVSVMFVGADNTSDLPPPRNLNFIWETPFKLRLTWKEPKGLDPLCKVNYTVIVQDCSSKEPVEVINKRVQNLSCEEMISNVHKLCVHVSTNPENCGERGHSQSADITIPPPPVRLVSDRHYEYSHDRMKCTWRPTDGVQNLSLYYWKPNESIRKCIPDETMKTSGCIIHDEDLVKMTAIFYMFNGTYNGIPVKNTFKANGPQQNVKLNKPQCTIQRKGQELFFQTKASDLDEFGDHCYSYLYTYVSCNKNISVENKNMTLVVQYDPACKYTARVQVFFRCGAGRSDPSDEVEYGEDSDPNLPALLAVIIIPLIVSFCLLIALLLLRRYKDILFPKIPEPSLLFKDMFINNMRTTEDIRSPAAGKLYVPTEEIVETGISLEPDTSFLLTMPHKPK